MLGRRCDLTAALGARLLFDADGLNKTLLEKLDDGIPQDARYLANFEEVWLRSRDSSIVTSRSCMYPTIVTWIIR